MENNQKPEIKKTSGFKLDKTNIIILVVFVVLSILTAIGVFTFAKNIISTWTMTNIGGLPVLTNPSSSTPNANSETDDPLIQSAIDPIDIEQIEPWDGVSRVTVLLMGLDYRDWVAGEIPRTDTMMLITVDPVAKEAAMLSIPRDMWVNIPGFDHARINTAYYLGELWKMPGGGPGLAVETVEEFLGVPINYYAQVDFMAFVRIIDEIKGVTVTPKMDVKVDPIGDEFKQTLEAGKTYTLTGPLTLAYARARYTEGGDFDRAERQQEVVYAIRDRVLKFSMWPTLIAKAPILYQEISSGINTNMRFEDAIRLANLALELEREDIKSFIIDASYVQFGTSADDQKILIPVPDKIRILRDEVFSSGGPLGPIAIQSETGEDVDVYDLVKIENARISVQNGSWYTGLAGETANYLRSKGYNIIEETNAEGTDISSLTLYNAKPYSIQGVFKIFEEAGISTLRLKNSFDPDSPVDVILILGNDWANYVNANPLPIP
ncbi:MAG TPA: LCP family protein [Anaerolineaceae bacterium]|nr:LCP family protein [Anaerolineaceae bacterium]